MIRILQIVDSMHQGGIQAFLMNLYRNIDRELIQFDFLIFRQDKQWYEDEINSLGGRIYKCPGRREGIATCHKYLKSFFGEHKEYNAVHYNASSLSFIAPLYFARKSGIEIRIIHCHSSSFIGNKIHKILHKINKRKIYKLANVYLSCSEPATEWMFGGTSVIDKVQIVLNGVDSKKFLFSDNIRGVYRRKLNIENDFVVGHVGRFSKVKNHFFIIRVFEEIIKLNNSAKLLLVGDGELRKEIENVVASKGLNSSVLFLGSRNDVPELMQAMDVLVMPSLYEGFPVTAVEAQAAGLPVIISDTITREVCINPNVKMLNLDDSSSSWATDILKSRERIISVDRIIDSGLDIKNTSEKLSKIYMGM